MKFGFCLPHDGVLSKPENLTELALCAEKLGFDTLVEPSDHIVMPNKIRTVYPYSVSGEYTDSPYDLDQATTLSFVAAKTEKIRLMTGIAVIPYRNPLATANSLATVDYLSNGRLDVGVGVGWMKEEFDLLRIPFAERGEIMDENLRILKTVWSEKEPSFRGKYFQFSDVHFSPKVVQKPHPPIWVGGESPRAIRRAAELGDAWFPIGANPNFLYSNAEEFSQGIARFRRELTKRGRDPNGARIGYFSQDFELRDNSLSTERKAFVGDSAKIISDLREFERLGAGFIVMNFLRDDNLEKTKAYSEKFANEILRRI